MTFRRVFRDRKGVSFGRLAIALASLFFLTTMYIFIDPVYEDNIHASLYENTDSSAAKNVLNNYLLAWHRWPIYFLAGLFIYVFTAGKEQDRGGYS